jgi:hypothetical protein
MRTIPLKEIIDTKGKHEIGISAYNSYGEGPQAIASVDIAGIPFTIDTEEVSIIDINGNPLTEILSCGQKIIAYTTLNNKQLPTEIVINNAQYTYTKNAQPTSAIIEINKITGTEVEFVFGELPAGPPTVRITDGNGRTLGTYVATDNY